MAWEEFMLELSRMYVSWPPLDILLIHLGGKDIGQIKTLKLVVNIQNTIRLIKMPSPHTVLFFCQEYDSLNWLFLNHLK